MQTRFNVWITHGDPIIDVEPRDYVYPNLLHNNHIAIMPGVLQHEHIRDLLLLQKDFACEASLSYK